MPITVGGSEESLEDFSRHAESIGANLSSAQAMPSRFDNSFHSDYMIIPEASSKKSCSFEHKLNTVYVRCMQIDWKRTKRSVIHELLVAYTDLIVDYNPFFSGEESNIGFEIKNRILNEHIPQIKKLCEQESTLKEAERAEWVAFFNAWSQYQGNLDGVDARIEKAVDELSLNRDSLEYQLIDIKDLIATWNSVHEGLSSWNTLFSSLMQQAMPSNVRQKLMEKEQGISQSFSFVLQSYEKDLTVSFDAEIAEIHAYQKYLESSNDPKSAALLLESQSYEQDIRVALQTMSLAASSVLKVLDQNKDKALTKQRERKTFVHRCQSVKKSLDKLEKSITKPQEGFVKQEVDADIYLLNRNKGLAGKTTAWSSKMARQLKLVRYLKVSGENCEKPCTWGCTHWVVWGLGMLSAVNPVDTLSRVSASWTGLKKAFEDRGPSNTWQQHYYDVRLSEMNPDQLKTYELQMHELESLLETFSLDDLRAMSGNFVQSHAINGIPAAKAFIESTLNRYSGMEGKLNADQRQQAMTHYLNFYAQEYDFSMPLGLSDVKSIHEHMRMKQPNAQWENRDLIVCATTDISGPFSKQWTKASHEARAIDDEILSMGSQLTELSQFPEHEGLNEVYKGFKEEVRALRMRTEKERCSVHDQGKEAGSIQELFSDKKALESKIVSFRDELQRFSQLRRSLQDKKVLLDGRKYVIQKLIGDVQKLGLNEKKERLDDLLKQVESWSQNLSTFAQEKASEISGDAVSSIFKEISHLSNEIVKEENTVQQELNKWILESWKNEEEREIVTRERLVHELVVDDDFSDFLETILSPHDSPDILDVLDKEATLESLANLISSVVPDEVQDVLFLDDGGSSYTRNSEVMIYTIEIHDRRLDILRLLDVIIEEVQYSSPSIKTLNILIEGAKNLQQYLDQKLAEGKELIKLTETEPCRNPFYQDEFSGSLISRLFKVFTDSLDETEDFRALIANELNTCEDEQAALADKVQLKDLKKQLEDIYKTLRVAFSDLQGDLRTVFHETCDRGVYVDSEGEFIEAKELLNLSGTTIFVQKKSEGGISLACRVMRVSENVDKEKKFSLVNLGGASPSFVSSDYQLQSTPFLTISGTDEQTLSELIHRSMDMSNKNLEASLFGYKLQQQMLEYLHLHKDVDVQWKLEGDVEAPLGAGTSFFEYIVGLILKQDVSKGKKDRLVFDLYWGILAHRMENGKAPSNALLTVFNQKMRALRNRSLITDLELDYIGSRIDELLKNRVHESALDVDWYASTESLQWDLPSKYIRAHNGNQGLGDLYAIDLHPTQLPEDILAQKAADLRTKVIALPFENPEISLEELQNLSKELFDLDLSLGEGIANRSEDRFWLMMKLFVIQCHLNESDASLRMLASLFHPQIVGAFSSYSEDLEIDAIALHIRTLLNESPLSKSIKWQSTPQDFLEDKSSHYSNFDELMQILSFVQDEHTGSQLEELAREKLRELADQYQEELKSVLEGIYPENSLLSALQLMIKEFLRVIIFPALLRKGVPLWSDRLVALILVGIVTSGILRLKEEIEGESQDEDTHIIAKCFNLIIISIFYSLFPKILGKWLLRFELTRLFLNLGSQVLGSLSESLAANYDFLKEVGTLDEMIHHMNKEYQRSKHVPGSAGAMNGALTTFNKELVAALNEANDPLYRQALSLALGLNTKERALSSYTVPVVYPKALEDQEQWGDLDWLNSLQERAQVHVKQEESFTLDFSVGLFELPLHVPSRVVEPGMNLWGNEWNIQTAQMACPLADVECQELRRLIERPETTLVSTVGFFLKPGYKTKLLEPGYRTLFIKNLFAPGLLAQELQGKGNTRFVKKLNQVLSWSLDESKRQERWSDYAQFVEVLIGVRAYLDYYSNDDVNLLGHVSSSEDHLLDVFSSSNNYSLQEKRHLAMRYLHSFSSTKRSDFSEKESVLLWKSYTLYRSLPAESEGNKDLNASIDRAWEKLNPLLKSSLGSVDLLDLFQLSSSREKGDFIKSEGLFLHPDIVFDHLPLGWKEQSGLRESMIVSNVRRVGKYGYVFQDQNGYTYRIEKKEGGFVTSRNFPGYGVMHQVKLSWGLDDLPPLLCRELGAWDLPEEMYRKDRQVFYEDPESGLILYKTIYANEKQQLLELDPVDLSVSYKGLIQDEHNPWAKSFAFLSNWVGEVYLFQKMDSQYPVDKVTVSLGSGKKLKLNIFVHWSSEDSVPRMTLGENGPDIVLDYKGAPLQLAEGVSALVLDGGKKVLIPAYTEFNSDYKHQRRLINNDTPYYIYDLDSETGQLRAREKGEGELFLTGLESADHPVRAAHTFASYQKELSEYSDKELSMIQWIAFSDLADTALRLRCLLIVLSLKEIDESDQGVSARFSSGYRNDLTLQLTDEYFQYRYLRGKDALSYRDEKALASRVLNILNEKGEGAVEFNDYLSFSRSVMVLAQLDPKHYPLGRAQNLLDSWLSKHGEVFNGKGIPRQNSIEKIKLLSGDSQKKENYDLDSIDFNVFTTGEAPLVTDLSRYFEIKRTPVKAQDNTQVENLVSGIEATDLQQKRLNKGLEEDFQGGRNALDKEVFYLKDKGTLADIGKDLEQHRESLTIATDALQAELLNRVNSRYPGSGLKLDKISFIEIKRFFASEALEELKSLNEGLTTAILQEVHEGMMQYLTLKRRLQQTLRAQKELDKVQRADKTEKKHEALQDLARAMAWKPAYKIQDDLVKAVVEETLGIGLRDKQVQVVDEYREANADDYTQHIMQLIMGFGKSFALIPTLALHNADGEHLSIFVIPEELLQGVWDNLEHVFRNSVDRVLYRFKFSRANTNTLQSFKELEEDLISAQKEKRVVVTEQTSYESLFLYAQEIGLEIANAAHSSPEKLQGILEKAAVVKRILKLLLDNGLMHCDEADRLMRIHEELNFSLGIMQGVTPVYGRTCAHLVNTLVSHKTVSSILNLGLGKTIHNEERYTESKYNEKLKKPLIEAFLEELQENKKEDYEESLVKEIKKLSKKDKKQLVNLMAEGGKKHPEGLDIYKTLSDETKEIISLVYGLTNVILPAAFGKEYQENYGLAKTAEERAEVPFAFPYSGNGVPKNGSLFANHFLTYILTIFSYSQALNSNEEQDVLDEHFTTFFENQFKSATTQIQRTQAEDEENDLKLNQTMGYKLFAKRCGGESDELLKVFNNGSTAENVAKLREAARNEMSVLLETLNENVLHGVGYYPLELSFLSHYLDLIAKKTQGFTGTTDNKDVFADDLNIIEETGTTAATATLFVKKAKGEVFLTNVEPQVDLDQAISGVLSQVKAKHGDRLLALSDPGAFFRGISNERVATHLINSKQLDHVEYVVYYDTKNNKRMWKRGAEVSEAFDPSISWDKRLVYYDQVHCTGADFKHVKDARMLMILGEKNSLRDVAQTEYRMRQIAENQGLSVCLNKPVADLIVSELGLKNANKIDSDEIFEFILKQDGQRRGRDNVLSIENEMKRIFLKAVYEKKLEMDAKYWGDLYKNLDDFFVKKNLDVPSQMFSLETGKISGHAYMTWRLDGFIEKVTHWVESTPLLSKIVDLELLIQEIRDSVKWEALPNEYEMNMSNVDRIVESIGEAQSETQSEQETETQSEQENQRYKGQNLNVDHVIPDWEWSLDLVTDPDNLVPTSPADPTPKDMTGKMQPVYQINEIMGQSKGLEPYKDLFDPALQITFNAFPNNYPVPGSLQAKLFDDSMEISEAILVVQKEDGDYQFIMLDMSDFGWWKEELNKNSSENEEGKLSPYTLYRLGYKVVASGKGAISPVELVKDEKFQNLLVQYRFLKGDINFSKAEIKRLEAWMQEKGKSKVRRLYDEHIRFTRPELQEYFPTSRLYTLLYS